jgi:hypothetical protein
MSLGVTTNAGVGWRNVYSGPTGGAGREPFETPFVFVDSFVGFGSVGDPPIESAGFWGSCFFYTADGGVTWTPESPPLPVTNRTCSQTSSSLYGSP